jgi:hypothetical protein
MRIRVGPTTTAWEPLTPRGVAAYAGAPLGRLLATTLIVAAVVGATVIWFLASVWFPTVRQAIRRLPPQGEIRQAKLVWPGDSPVKLAGDRFLALTLDLNHDGELGHDADVCLDFGRGDVRVWSLAGYTHLAYPAGWVIAFNRSRLDPWWGAWEPVVLAAAGAAAGLALMVIWTLQAAVYAAPARLIGTLANRDLNWLRAWKLAVASLMPGALMMVAGMIGYGTGLLDLVKLAVCTGLHLVVGWAYVAISPLFLPREPAASPRHKNPFAAPAPR